MKTNGLLPTTEERKVLGRQLRAARSLRGLQAKEVAEMVEINADTLTTWECGKGSPSIYIIEKLCAHVYGMTPEALRALPAA